MFREHSWSPSSSCTFSFSFSEEKWNSLSNWLATDLVFFIFFAPSYKALATQHARSSVCWHPSTMIPYNLLLWQDVCWKLPAQAKSHFYFISPFESSFKCNFDYRNEKGQSSFLLNINRSRCQMTNIIKKIPVKSEYLTPFPFIKSSTVQYQFTPWSYMSTSLNTWQLIPKLTFFPLLPLLEFANNLTAPLPEEGMKTWPLFTRGGRSRYFIVHCITDVIVLFLFKVKQVSNVCRIGVLWPLALKQSREVRTLLALYVFLHIQEHMCTVIIYTLAIITQRKCSKGVGKQNVLPSFIS